MSFAARLIHRLAVVAPVTGDPEDEADLDDYGHAEALPASVVLVRGLVQPRTSQEVETVSQGGPEIGDHVIYLTPRQIPPGAWIRDADESGIIPTGRRFDVIGVRDFAFGRSPHLEVDVRLVGSSEDPATGS